ncbi:FAD-dependent oxidoreductase, partial [Cohaesibacter celericrescens]
MSIEITKEQDELFHMQLDVLKKHLAADPKSLNSVFVADGTQAMAWEFQQPEIGERFISVLWNLLLRDDDMSIVLQRFLWDLPLKFKRKFIKALDTHLSDRYPMFKGLSVDWPANNYIPPYIRPAEDRSKDFELVNQGYLGYQSLGYSLREVDMFVWLEVLRDKQCEDKPCELGVLMERHRKMEKVGGCPVKIHIPEMIDLIGKGKIRQALELIESCNPLPNVTGRVCPQEHQCQGVCKHTKRPIEIGQIEWYLPEHEKLADPDRMAKYAGIPNPWDQAEKPPIAVVGSGPSGLINAYLLAVEGFPVTVFEAFHELGGVLRYGIPEFRLPNSLIDDVVAKIDALGGRFVKNFVVGKTATLDDLKEAGFWKIFVGSGAGLPTFMNVPGEHLLGVMSANEFLTRVNLMRGLDASYETPLPDVKDKNILIIGGGNTAMDAARTAKRLGGNVTIVYRRTQSEMP